MDISAIKAVILCVAKLTALNPPDHLPTVTNVTQEQLEQAIKANKHPFSTGAYFRPPNAIFLGPRASKHLLAHEVTHWLLYQNGLPYRHSSIAANIVIADVHVRFSHACR